MSLTKIKPLIFISFQLKSVTSFHIQYYLFALSSVYRALLEIVNWLGQLSVTITKYLRQLIKRKDFLWLTILEGLVMIDWCHCFGPVARYCPMAGAHGE